MILEPQAIHMTNHNLSHNVYYGYNESQKNGGKVGTPEPCYHA
jgi:hypothetical protein